MLRNRLLPVVRLVSPLLAVTLLLPATAGAQEALQIGPVAAPEAAPVAAPESEAAPQVERTAATGASSPRARSLSPARRRSRPKPRAPACRAS